MNKQIVESIKKTIEHELTKESDRFIEEQKNQLEERLIKKRTRLIASLVDNIEIFVQDDVPNLEKVVHIKVGGLRL